MTGKKTWKILATASKLLITALIVSAVSCNADGTVIRQLEEDIGNLQTVAGIVETEINGGSMV